MQSALENHQIDEGLDRQNLAILRRRFGQINDNRRERLINALSERQKLFIHALPLLFHTNHPMMPGYVSRQTPARIANFKPTKEDLRVGKMVARSFTFNYDPTEPQIEGLYVMGSVGTIAQSGRSDLDIWLCHKPDLTQTQRRELKAKCDNITEWATSLRLEVHIFPMDVGAFRKGKTSSLDEESSGSAQRLLLLDEFYRTAIYLGGRLPLWWFVPEHHEKNYEEYTRTLIQKRFLRDDEVIDFGGIPTIPDSEFLGAGIWQLYKAIESPYKSALKLMLLEAYASEYPNITPLCLRFKKMVYAGVLSIDKLDGYVLIFQRIAQHLTLKKQYKRLELARRCFYFKVNKAISKPPQHTRRSWQREMLENLIHEWGWNRRYVVLLDERHHWKVPQVAQERGLLVRELNYSYQQLMEFASNCGSAQAISTEELTILGRKLQAAYERRPGKIEWINPGISKDVSEGVLSINESLDSTSNTKHWIALSREAGATLHGAGEAIKSSNSLVELLLWCHYNSVTTAQTYYDLQNTPSLSEFELRKLLGAFQQWLPNSEEPLAHHHFERASLPTKVLMLVNVGKNPNPKLDQTGVQRLSGSVDALRYSGFEENLVVSVDMVTCNSWNEINTRRFDSDNALLDALLEYLHLCLPGTHQKPPSLTIECIGAAHASIINHRTRNWFREIAECYYSGRYSPSTRYIFQTAGMLYSLQFKGLRPVLIQHKNHELLIEHLGAEQPTASPIVLDSYAMRKHPMRAVAKIMATQSIGIFYRRFDFGMEMYITDEKGSLSYFMLRGSRDYSPLAPLHRFLRAVLNREARSQQNISANYGIFPVNFFELRKGHEQEYECITRRISTDLQSPGNVFEVKAIAHTDNNGQILFDFYCDDQEFSALSFGDQLHLVVAQFVLSRRRTQQNYPVYITDLDLSLCSDRIAHNGNLQTSHYLQVKNALEFQLNQAIGILLRA